MFSINNSDLVVQAQALIANEPNKIANLANLSALLKQVIQGLNWAGFYLVDSPDELVLGPFQGMPACIRIPFSKGVCGAAARHKQTQRVADVHAIDDHIACDINTKSELVVPIIVGEAVVAVIDLDSPTSNHFTSEHVVQVEALASLISDQWQQWH